MLFNQSSKIMIRWRLRVLMAEKKLNNKTLAKETGIHPTTISRLKNMDELKQISGEVLNALCNALECTPNDLIEFTPDFSPDQPSSVVELRNSDSPSLNKLSTGSEEENIKAVA